MKGGMIHLKIGKIKVSAEFYLRGGEGT